MMRKPKRSIKSILKCLCGGNTWRGFRGRKQLQARARRYRQIAGLEDKVLDRQRGGYPEKVCVNCSHSSKSMSTIFRVLPTYKNIIDLT